MIIELCCGHVFQQTGRAGELHVPICNIIIELCCGQVFQQTGRSGGGVSIVVM